MADQSGGAKREGKQGAGNAFLTVSTSRRPPRTGTRHQQQPSRTRGRGARGDSNGEAGIRGRRSSAGERERGRVGIVALGDMGGSSGPTSQRHTAMVTATATRAARTRGDAGRWMRIERLSSRADLKQTASRLVDRFIVLLLLYHIEMMSER